MQLLTYISSKQSLCCWQQ